MVQKYIIFYLQMLLILSPSNVVLKTLFGSIPSDHGCPKLDEHLTFEDFEFDNNCSFFSDFRTSVIFQVQRKDVKVR